LTTKSQFIIASMIFLCSFNEEALFHSASSNLG
jgi:hypothetical protein